MSVIFNQLDNDEKVALEVAIIYPHKALSTVLPDFYGNTASKSTLYRYHKEGADKLVSKGFLDRERRPTAIAFDIVPESALKKMTMKLHLELTQLYNEKSNVDSARFIAESELRKMREQIEKLESSLRNVTQQLALVNQNKIQNVIQRFGFLGIDENWVSVLVALNLVEMSMKQKIESLGIKPRGSFKELYDLLEREISTKEKREIRASSVFIKPKHLYDFRSKMDHDGLKVKIKEEEADFLIE